MSLPSTPSRKRSRPPGFEPPETLPENEVWTPSTKRYDLRKRHPNHSRSQPFSNDDLLEDHRDYQNEPARKRQVTTSHRYQDQLRDNDHSRTGFLERTTNYANSDRNSPNPCTPKKRQKNSADSPSKPGSPVTPGSRTGRRQGRIRTTPRKTGTLTPTHARLVVKKPLTFTPLGSRVILAPPGQGAASVDAMMKSPYRLTRSRLMGGGKLGAGASSGELTDPFEGASGIPLPCREDEFASIYSHLEQSLLDGQGTCTYIAGVPGSGKTATVGQVVAALYDAVEADQLPDFVFVEINGMALTEPRQAYSVLWQAIRGERVSPAHALSLLDRDFSHPHPERRPVVVLMDELDQLMTSNQAVMYNFFNWPALPHSQLVVIAVANTMDLPERFLSNKINSRLGEDRFFFS